MSIRYAACRALLVLYSIAVETVVWLVMVPVTAVRHSVGRARVRELRDRLYGAPASSEARVLVHAVSAGEMVAAEPLVRRLAPRRVLLTTQTCAGLDAAARIRAMHAHVEGCVFLPWDRFAIRGWLKSSGVTAAVIVETEIWPNLFAGCRALRIPLFVVNGRMAERERRRYSLARVFFADVLRCATAIGVQDQQARDAFVSVGAPAERVHIGGNMKLDARLLPNVFAAPIEDELRRTPLIVAGSTHDPEEQLLIDCLRLLRRTRDVRMAVAPRDTVRAPQICRLAERSQLRAVLLSQLLASDEQTPDWDVLIIDEFGWLTACYALACAVFIGGTIAPIGGHSIAEAALVGRPVVVGPQVANISAMVEALERAGGALTLGLDVTPDTLRDACESLLVDPERARQIGAAGRHACEQASGAVDRYCAALMHHIPAAPAQ